MYVDFALLNRYMYVKQTKTIHIRESATSGIALYFVQSSMKVIIKSGRRGLVVTFLYLSGNSHLSSLWSSDEKGIQN